MTTRLVLIVIFGLGSLARSASGADWPQRRGPERHGVSKETGLLKEWPKGGPKLLWQVKDIGDGYSTPAVVGDRLYVISNKGMDNEFVQARDVGDGKEIWARRIGKVGPNGGPNYPGSRSTTTIDGDLLYALGSDGDLACLETATGTARWTKNLRTEFSGQPGKWAYAESPLIDGKVLVCTPGGKTATLVALNKANGEPIWQSAVPGGDPAAYASVIVVDVDGMKQYVQFLQNGVVGVDAKSGKFLWRYDKTGKNPANIPTPVAHANYVFSSGGGRGGGAGGLVKLAVNKQEVAAEQVYFNKDLPTSIGGAVQFGEYLYGTNGRGLLCAEFATGKLKWQDKAVGPGAICYADGCLYVRCETGEVVLVEATPEAFREKGRFTPPDQPTHNPREVAWPYPVVANGRLYFRDKGSLWCYDVKNGG